jgi:hypothetical protein
MFWPILYRRNRKWGRHHLSALMYGVSTEKRLGGLPIAMPSSSCACALANAFTYNKEMLENCVCVYILLRVYLFIYFTTNMNVSK